MDGQNTSTWPPMADDPFAEVVVEATPVREEPPVREPVRPLAGEKRPLPPGASAVFWRCGA